MVTFLKNLVSMFVKPQYILDAGEDLKKIRYSHPNCQLEDSKIRISRHAHTGKGSFWMMVMWPQMQLERCS